MPFSTFSAVFFKGKKQLFFFPKTLLNIAPLVSDNIFARLRKEKKTMCFHLQNCFVCSIHLEDERPPWTQVRNFHQKILRFGQLFLRFFRPVLMNLQFKLLKRWRPSIPCFKKRKNFCRCSMSRENGELNGEAWTRRKCTFGKLRCTIPLPLVGCLTSE